MQESPTLKSLKDDATFWVLLAMSVPGIIAAYLAAYHGVTTGDFQANDFYSAVFAAPIVVYLGIGRQYARGKVVEQAGQILVAREAAQIPGVSSVTHSYFPLDTLDEESEDAPTISPPEKYVREVSLPMYPASVAEAARNAAADGDRDGVGVPDDEDDSELPSAEEAISTAIAPPYDPKNPEVRDADAESTDARGEQ